MKKRMNKQKKDEDYNSKKSVQHLNQQQSNNNRKYKTKEDQAKSVQHLNQTKHAHTIFNQS
jgi:hypothetical protein